MAEDKNKTEKVEEKKDKVSKKPVGIMETVLRDAHQSLIATRMPTEIMLPIIDQMDEIGSIISVGILVAIRD